MSETERLQRLCAGEFGDAYSDRNAEAHAGRDRFRRTLLSDIDPTSALEVGCNGGGNFHWLVELLPEARLATHDLGHRPPTRLVGKVDEDARGEDQSRELGGWDDRAWWLFGRA